MCKSLYIYSREVKRDFEERLPISMDKGGRGCEKIVIFPESEIEAASVLARPSFEILHVTSPWTGRIKPFFERVHMGSREGPG